MAETHGIYILAETREDKQPTSITLELLGLGQGLSSSLGAPLYALLLGSGTAAAAQELAAYGPGEVLYLDDPSLHRYDPEIYVDVLIDFFQSRPPRALLAGHTSLGQDLLPRLAFALDCGLVTDCVALDVTGGEIFFTRPVYGGNALATQKANTPTVMATVRARVGEAPAPTATAAAVAPLEAALPGHTRLEFKGRELLSGKECPLEEAPVVVSGGRGIGGEEGFGQLREIAGAPGRCRGRVPPARRLGLGRQHLPGGYNRQGGRPRHLYRCGHLRLHPAPLGHGRVGKDRGHQQGSRCLYLQGIRLRRGGGLEAGAPLLHRRAQRDWSRNRG